MRSNTIILVALALVRYASGSVHSRCNVLARTEAGWVCGQERAAENGARYASFRGIPYAKQPLGELRFKELQPADPWKGVLNATIEGPVCYQNNVFFGPLMAPHGTSESCITANVHVPLRALPRPGEKRTAGGLPIFVFYHGGGWACGSGDSDVYGPEFMLGRDVIVITFNYRLDVLGFLSLGTAKIPGNNGLRDAITLLRWVQRNARRFGGNPDEVTLAGESAGSNNAHWLSLSPAAKGLFKRVWLMSGTAIPGLQITAPAYAQQLATSYLESLGLSGLDYDTVHDKLVQMPIETLYNASSQLLLQSFTTFMPVQESPLPGVTAIIPEDPEKMLANGNGDDIPLVAGYNSNECQSFHFRIIELNLVEKTNENPVNAVPPQLPFVLPESETAAIAENIKRKYFGDELTLDKYKKVCSDLYMAGPTLRFVRERAARGGAPVYLYKFSYEAVHSVIKQVFGIEYSGAAHIEDLNNILKVNSIPVPASTADDNMKEWMSGLAVNFVKTGAPSLDNSWPPQAGGESLKYYDIVTPFEYNYIEVSDEDNAIGDVYDIETS